MDSEGAQPQHSSAGSSADRMVRGGGSVLAHPSGEARQRKQTLTDADFCHTLTDKSVARPVPLTAPGPEPQSNYPIWILGGLLLLALYADSSVALIQQVYKGSQLAKMGEGCEELWSTVLLGYQTLQPEAGTEDEPVCQTMLTEAKCLAGKRKEKCEWKDDVCVGRQTLPQSAVPDTNPITMLDPASLVEYRKLGETREIGIQTEAVDDECPHGRFKTGDWTMMGKKGCEQFDRNMVRPYCSWILVQAPKAGRDDFVIPDKEKELCTDKHKDAISCNAADYCAWKVEKDQGTCLMKDCDSASGKVCYKRKPTSFTKGAALSLQASCGIMGYWTFNFITGGWEQLKMCWDLKEIIRFSVVGALFGFSAVCSFLGQANLTPGSYTLYAQAGVICVPIMWRICFKSPIPYLTWLHIFMVGFGIVMYFMAELKEDQGLEGGIGLFWVGCKVLVAGGASVVAEMFLKGGDSNVPFSVQVSYILPSKALMCFLTIFLLPPHGFPPRDIRPGLFFHDWTPLTFVIIFHNLGDTVCSAAVAKVFDSVVKAICGVVGIIFPTWVVSYSVGWDPIEFSKTVGKFKACGALVVVLSSLAYVLGRSQAKELTDKEEKLAALTKAQESRKRSDVEAGQEAQKWGGIEMRTTEDTGMTDALEKSAASRPQYLKDRDQTA